MSQLEPQDREQVLAQIVAHCWSDPGFLADLQSNPEAVLRANGFPVGPGVRVTVAVDTPDHITIAIPQRPLPPPMAPPSAGDPSPSAVTEVCIRGEAR